jgi:3-dehydrotetronate 4-kinase
MAIFLAAVADDDTGAADLAGMLAERGMRAILIIDEPSPENFRQWTADADAVVIGTASRSIPPHTAYDRTRRAVQVLRTLQPEVLQIKYCSTFDSTPAGNIGPAIDAALDETGESFTIALPALPVNGRTTYMGYHFVGQQLLSDSPMRNHPLNPMTNPNLVSHLESQTKRRVGLLAYPDVRSGPTRIQECLAQLRVEGVEIAVTDCTSDEDLENICEAIGNLPVITGSSAPAMALPLSWTWKPPQPLLSRRQNTGKGFLVVAGSCSEATSRQNEWLASQDVAVVTMDALELAGATTPHVPPVISESLEKGRTCLLQVSRDHERVHEHFRAGGKTEVEAGESIARGLANVVGEAISAVLPEGLIVAGGETSSAISRRLGFGAVRVGPNIEPGVPVCVPVTNPALPVVFKSGNFGSEYFYGKAMNAIRHLHAINNESS